MATFRAAFSRHLRVGTSTALAGGALLGLGLGLWLVMLDDSVVLFPTMWSRVMMVAFLASLFALTASAALIPLELIMAGFAAGQPSASQVHARTFYAGALAIGVAALHAALSLVFNLVRNITSPKGLAFLTAIAATGLALLIVVALSAPRDRTADDRGPRAAPLVAVLTTMLVVCVVSHRGLSAATDRPPGSSARDRSTAAAAADTGGASAPNVILISIDTLRADHLGVYGYPRATSPHLDALAADGTTFVNARSQAPWTLPSHASMLTSLYPSSHGVRFASISNFQLLQRRADRLSDAIVTLPELLHAANFRTAAFTSVVWLSAAFGFDQGFDEFEVSEESGRAATLVDRAMRWSQSASGRPFFMFMHFYEVHEYNPPAEYFARFRSQTEPSRFEHEPDFKRDLMSSFYQGLPDADRRYIVAKYDGSLAYVDAELGRLFAWLRDTNQYDNTMVVVTADHGAEFWDHNGTGHGFTLYDEQLHVPLIVKAPGSAGRGRRVADNAASIDIVPTILAFVGLPAPPFMQGISLRPAMETGAAPAARSLFAEDTTLFNSYAKVDGSLKYIENRVPPADLLNLGLLFANVRSFYRFRANELFRLDRDPREQANVLGSDRDTGARMRTELLAHIAHPVDRTEMRMDDQTIKRLRSLGYIK